MILFVAISAGREMEWEYGEGKGSGGRERKAHGRRKEKDLKLLDFLMRVLSNGGKCCYNNGW